MGLLGRVSERLNASRYQAILLHFGVVHFDFIVEWVPVTGGTKPVLNVTCSLKLPKFVFDGAFAMFGIDPCYQIVSVELTEPFG